MLNIIKKLFVIYISGFLLIAYVPRFNNIVLASNSNTTNNIAITNKSTTAKPDTTGTNSLVTAKPNTILDTPWLSVGYSMVAAGARYCQKQNLPEYRLARYAEHTLSASREFRLDRVRLRLQAEAVNLTDAQYEAVRFYPMPGRSYRGTLQIEL